MRTARELTCGLTYHDFINCAGMNQRQAAEKLGISHSHFNRVVRRLSMGHWYSDIRPRPRRVTKEDIIDIAKEGFIMKDAAAELELSYSYFQKLVEMWELRDLFPTLGEAHSIAYKGYCS